MNSLEVLFRNKKLVEVPDGKIVVYEGHEVNKIYRVNSGYIKVYTVTGAGTQRILFMYKSGDVFPLTTFLSGQSVTRFFYESLTPTTLQSITPRQLENKLRNNLQLGEEIIRYTSYLDRQFLDRINNIVSNKDPRAKINAALFFLCNRISSRSNMIHINFPVNAKFIASMCGVSSKEASKQIKLLKSEGIITLNDGVIIDKKALKTFPLSTNRT